ncbi:hypothetical protein RIF29_33920 [Crotalaria pallida]|uniref:Uncharacterized protein n=1 Tax=Crotalaria pallida TaxID=3830 RepID=A0AAN9E8C8_CROPI
MQLSSPSFSQFAYWGRISAVLRTDSVVDCTVTHGYERSLVCLSMRRCLAAHESSSVLANICVLQGGAEGEGLGGNDDGTRGWLDGGRDEVLRLVVLAVEVILGLVGEEMSWRDRDCVKEGVGLRAKASER